MIRCLHLCSQRLIPVCCFLQSSSQEGSEFLVINITRITRDFTDFGSSILMSLKWPMSRIQLIRHILFDLILIWIHWSQFASCCFATPIILQSGVWSCLFMRIEYFSLPTAPLAQVWTAMKDSNWIRNEDTLVQTDPNVPNECVVPILLQPWVHWSLHHAKGLNRIPEARLRLSYSEPSTRGGGISKVSIRTCCAYVICMSVSIYLYLIISYIYIIITSRWTSTSMLRTCKNQQRVK